MSSLWVCCSHHLLIGILSVLNDIKSSLQWRHNERDGVTNHRPHICLLDRVFGRISKKTSKLRGTGHLCGEFTGWPVNSLHKGSVTRKMFPFDDVIIIDFDQRHSTDYAYGSRFNTLRPTQNGHHFANTYLTHWGRDKMAAILQMTFSHAFSWINMYEFRLKFHRNMFLRVQLITF